jgi:tetratricopeptide (TPR) repeat protein
MHIRLIIMSLLIYSALSGQDKKLNSIKETLPGLSEKNQVDACNVLGWEYYLRSIHSDSALKYAMMAERKAHAVSYSDGEGISLVIQAGVNGRLLGRIEIMEKLSRRALDILLKGGEKKNLSIAYFSMAMSMAMKGKYEDAQVNAERAQQIAKKVNDQSGLGWGMMASGFAYSKNGLYWEAFEKFIEAQKIGQEINDSLLISMCSAFIGRAFNRVGDPQTAMKYYHQALTFATPFLLLWPHLEDMAYAHLQLKQIDSAWHYQQKHKSNIEKLTTDTIVRKKFQIGNAAVFLLALKQYDQVLINLMPELKSLRTRKEVIPYMQSLLDIGRAFEGKRQFRNALGYYPGIGCCCACNFQYSIPEGWQ